MATMTKEKKPKKKKSKSKISDLTIGETEECIPSYVLEDSETPLVDFNIDKSSLLSSEAEKYRLENVRSQKLDKETDINIEPNIPEINEPNQILSITDNAVETSSKHGTSDELTHLRKREVDDKEGKEGKKVSELAYKDLNTEIENITIYDEQKKSKVSDIDLNKVECENADNVQDVSPSAPMFHDSSLETVNTVTVPAETTCNIKTKVSCLPIEEVFRIFGGKEMYAVKELSDQEEALVEVGGHLQPQHPLVDLITHLRSSLAAVERERQRISYGYKEEQKARLDLWKIEKRRKNISEKCSCGADIAFLVTFDYAELQKNKLAAAKFRLESLLRDVLDSYCSHQHEAMLTYCEIEDLIGLIIQRSKLEIRDSLAFILQSLKCSDEFGDVFVKVLQEWAFVLASALFDKEPDMRDLLYLMHLLFRQSRSVRWVERVVRVRVDDFSTAARFIAFLDILLSQPVPESALECTEESQESATEAWEELDASGAGGAVGKGRLRESDLLAIIKVLPLRELIASLVLLSKEEMDGRHAESWSGAPGGGVLKASCGVRVLLRVTARALPLYHAYRAVHALLRRVALAALRALAALHLHSRSWYQNDIKDKISAELEACFVLGFTSLTEDRHDLPTTLLGDDTVVEYCITFMSSLHVNTARHIESLSVDAPSMWCAERVRIVAHAAAEQRNTALANTVLEFLLQTGIKRIQEPCKDKCESVARELIPRLLAAHPYLHTTAFYLLADIHKVEALDPSSVNESVKALSPAEWRPSPTDVQGVLDDWSRKSPALIEHLLLQIDCTPHKGLSLESQLVVGTWLCQYTRGRGDTCEWAWSALRRLRPHRALWGLPLEAPAPAATDTLMELAFALLASEWGHLVPMVCSAGVSALRRLAGARPADAVHVLDCVMRVLALSPESVALTPEFTDVFATILNAGPSLVQRALGRGGRSGQHMLQRLLLDQLHEYRSCAVRRSALLSAWLHALWRPALPAGGRAVLDAALRATRDWRTLDAHVMYVLEEGGSQMLCDAVTHAYVAPLLAHGALRGALEQRAGLPARLLPALAHQRRRGERVHVDNALKFIGSKLSSEELVIHRAAASVLLAPLEDPSHLTLWSLFFHVYLQRPPDATSEATPPAGPLFFSGIIKTRTLNQMKKRLQETMIYHRNAIKHLKSRMDGVTTAQGATTDNIATEPEDCMFPPLTLKDLTGEAELISESSIDGDNDGDVKVDSGSKKETDDTPNLISYHTAAEKLVTMYERWLCEGEAVRALQHHADVARFLTEQDLDAAWKASLGCNGSSSDTPPPSPRDETAPALTYYEQIIQAIDTFKSKPNQRGCPPSRSAALNIDFSDQRSVIAQVETHLIAIEKLVQSWSFEARRVRTLDEQLWPAVGRLRARTPLPSVRQPCPKGCRPVLVHIKEYEWRLSSAAAREIEENRRSAAAAVRRLAQPKTHAARVTAALIAISRRIADKEIAVRVLETMYCSVNDEKAPAHRSLISFITFLAERWVCSDGVASARLLQRWSGAGAHALCGALVHPAPSHARHWRPLYRALLQARLPPAAAFSYLSRFDMAYWATVVGEDERRDVLEAHLEAARCFGAKSDEEYQMLIELVGVHSGKVCLAGDTLRHVQRCARAAASASPALPPAYLAHLAPLVLSHRSLLDFTQLEQLFVELGAMWSVASGPNERYVAYAPHIAAMLRALLRTYVVAVTEQSYTPENVGGRAWAAARAAWSPWVAPGPPHLLPPGPPDPPGSRDSYTFMLDHFVDTLVQLMDDCPGCDIYLLCHVWEWTVETYLATPEQSQQTQLRATALLAQLRRLPWQRQWLASATLHTAHRVSWINVPAINAWCSHTWGSLTAASWLRGADEPQLQGVLPVLFELFTSKYLQLSASTFEEACRLPWHKLPAHVVEHLLGTYYTNYHNPAQPYHELPHFKLILSVSELGAECALDELAQMKRCQAVSLWVSRAASPALAASASAHTRRLLLELQRTATRIENCGSYLEEVMCRAVVMLCMEPAANEALPVWQQWVRECTPRARRAVATAIGTLAAADAFAPLADTLAQQLLADADCGGWCAVWQPLRGRPGAVAALRRRHYHAAHALLRAQPPARDRTRAAVAVLAAAPVPFVEKEVIISVWICALCRLAREFDSEIGRRSHGEETTCGADEQVDKGEVARDVRTLLSKWAEQKRSLLQVVTLQHATVPTQRHRLLCYLGLCVLSSPQPASVQSPCKDYESACQSASSLGVNPSDIIKLGQAPKASCLPRLAIMLFPDQKIYFEEELNLLADL